MRRSVSDSEDDEEKQRILSRAQKEVDASRQREDNLIAHLRDYRGRMEELHRKVNIEMYLTPLVYITQKYDSIRS